MKCKNDNIAVIREFDIFIYVAYYEYSSLNLQLPTIILTQLFSFFPIT